MWPKTKSPLIRRWSSRSCQLLTTSACVLLLALHSASSQPMMPDPAQMSGIPRPDPQVPAGTVTVRLIRGELSSRITDTAVELVPQGAPDKPILAKTDGEGRATFESLPPAVYSARATAFGQTLSSQPIEVKPAPASGVRVMLVFPKPAAELQKELGTPDGKARVDASTAAGNLLVKAVDALGQPLGGLRVTLVRVSRDGSNETLPEQTTAADGTVSYGSLRTGPDQGYMAIVSREGAEHRSQPFQLNAEHGSVLAMLIHNASHDVGALYIGQGSHVILEPQDDAVRVIENLILINPLQQPIDPGPSGLRVTLAEGALSPQVLPNGPPSLSIDATQDGAPAAVWKGPISPGQTMLSVGFLLKHRGALRFRQAASLRFESLLIGAMKLPNSQVTGLERQETRNLNGQDYFVGLARVPSPGGFFEVELSGLPTDFYLLRIVAALGALAIALFFVYLSIYGRTTDGGELERQRQELLTRREVLLDELLRTEALGALAESKGTEKQPRAKSKLRTPSQVRADLEELYRQLDESNGP